MRNRFTFSLVLAVALLLSVPIEAQEFQRTSRAQTKMFQTGRVDKPVPQKDPRRQEVAKTGPRVDAFDGLKAGGTSRSKQVARASESDLIVTPEAGVTKYYSRSGTGIGYSNGLFTEDQSGTVEIVETDNGTVYIKDIISHFIQGTWVKGTRNGNTITVAGGQPVAYNSRINATMSVNWGTYDSSQSKATRASGDIIFNVDGDNITLMGSSPTRILGIFWDDDNAWQGYGDYNTVWTLDESYEPPSTTPVTLPEGATAEDWYAVGSGSSTVPTDVKVAFVGSDVYICGIFADLPEAWIKGTLNGKKVTFESGQYLGVISHADVWAMGSNGSTFRDTYTFSYDTDARELTLDGGQAIIVSAATDRMFTISYIDALTILPPSELLTPPVSLDLTQSGAMRNFTVIDANHDNRTWTWDERFGIYYMYHPTNTADDYLILPIGLEAGKSYHLALTASTANERDTEKFEVKMGKSPAIADLNVTVIAEQSFASEEDVEFEGNFVSDEAGTYYLAVHATTDPDMWRLHIKKFVIEAGLEGNAPDAVSDLTVSSMSPDLGAVITFTAPTKTIDGTDLAADGITKIEILRDGTIIHTIEQPAPGAQLSYTDQGADLTVGTHKYQVIPYGAYGMGTKSQVVSVLLTSILEVPYYADFTQSGTIEVFQVLDNNHDGSTWSWNSAFDAFYSFDPINKADDYLITLPIHLMGGKIYTVKVKAKAYSSEYTERFEVVAGKGATAQALNISVIPPTELTSEGYEEFEGSFTTDVEGTYYVAIHAISDANTWTLQVSSLAVEKGPENSAPAAPTLEVVADATGALSATINVTAPTTDLDGNVLPADNLQKIVIWRDGNPITTITPAPGEQKSVTDKPSFGLHSYEAVPYDANGEEGMKSEKVNVFVGKDQLAAIQNFRVTGTTPSTISFAWDEVEGMYHGFIDPDNVTYTLYGLVVKNNGSGDYLDKEGTLASVQGATNTTTTINYPTDEGNQTYKYFGISVKNNYSGESDPTEANTFIVVGAPEELPVEEGFVNTVMHYAWNTNGIALVSALSSDDDGVAVALFSPTSNTTIHFLLDKVNLKPAVNPTLMIDVKSDVVDHVRVVGAADGGAFTTLATVNISADYTTLKVPLAAVKGDRYSSVGLEADFTVPSYINPYYSMFGDSLVVDNIRIVDLLQHNLSASVSTQKTVKAGQKASITATVMNRGEQAVNGYTIIIKAGDKELLNKTVNDVLSSFRTAEFTAEWETSIFDEAGDVTITATVVLDGDENPADNTSETTISIKESTAVQPLDLTGQQVGTDIVLSWTIPTEDVEVTEDVEELTSEDNGGLDTSIHTGNIGQWTVYDGNEGKVGYSLMNITTPIGKPGAWMVFNPGEYATSRTTLADYFPAHSGDQYLVSSCVSEPEDAIEATDHWLISPQLPGIAQTIQFYVREMDDQYGAEQFEVLASTTDSNPESFSVVENLSTSTTSWQAKTADLPAGTKYFAIRHTSTDIFALMLDDITYVAVGNDVESYNIYYEGELIAVVEGDETTYTGSTDQFTTGDHVFAVSAVHANGEESKPVTVTVTITDATGIEEMMVNGQPVDIYSIDGKLVRRQARDLNGLKGIYVINGKAVLVK